MKKTLIESMLNPKNWKPNISKIAKETNLSNSTVSEHIKRRIDNCEIEVQITNLSELEAMIKRGKRK